MEKVLGTATKAQLTKLTKELEKLRKTRTDYWMSVSRNEEERDWGLEAVEEELVQHIEDREQEWGVKLT